jgi:hypothetical protein
VRRGIFRATNMNQGEYNPVALANAMGIFKDFLKQISPAAMQMLESPTVGLSYLQEVFVYHFLDEDRNSFELLSKPPLVDFLAQAVQATEFDVKLRIKDLGTSLEHETSVEHTPSGIKIIRKIRDGSGNEQNVDRN